MDLATIIGFGLAFFCIIFSAILEAGHSGSPTEALVRLLNVPAALIVFGGTAGVIVISFKMKDVLGIPKYLIIAFKESKLEIEGLIADIVRYAEVARKEGLLKLEEMVAEVKDDFLRKGIQLVVDGTDPVLVREIMEIETEYMEERHKIGAQIFQQAGGFAPTLGIIGTVMGLVNVLANLADTSTLGPAISVAFIATFYGVFTANIICLPLANKLKLNSKKEAASRQIIIEGILSIQAGEHPRVISEKLMSFLPPSARAAANPLKDNKAER